MAKAKAPKHARPAKRTRATKARAGQDGTSAPAETTEATRCDCPAMKVPHVHTKSGPVEL